MFVFLILGILQLGLMHQARMMTKYAAYRAARAGSLWNAQKSKMQYAATAALLPVIAHRGSGADYVPKTAGAASFLQKWITTNMMQGRMIDYPALRYAEVQTCGPLKNEVGGGKEVDFDDPKVHWGAPGSAPNWTNSKINKLRVQVTLNYRMIIPFANVVIHGIFTNMGTNPVLHLGKTGRNPGGLKNTDYLVPRMMGLYIIPIRATYTMRMQSNIFTDQLPTENKCKFTFKY